MYSKLNDWQMVKFGFELENLTLIKEDSNVNTESGIIKKFIKIENLSIFFEFYDSSML